MINQPVYFASIASNLKIPVETVRFLNPAYKTNYIPKSSESVPLVLPANKISTFVQNQSKIFSFSFPSDSVSKTKNKITEEPRTLITHIVDKGEYLNKIALTYRCSVNQIMEWNNLTQLNLASGTILKIWAPSLAVSSVSEINNNEEKNHSTLFKKSIIYTIQNGDTIFSISQKFSGTTVAEIMKCNELTENSNLVPGTQIKINTFSN